MAANLATTTTTIATNTQTTSTIDPPGQAKNIGKEVYLFTRQHIIIKKAYFSIIKYH